MTEWTKVHAWKACVLQKGTKGSNPFLSAESSQEALFIGVWAVFSCKKRQI